MVKNLLMLVLVFSLVSLVSGQTIVSEEILGHEQFKPLYFSVTSNNATQCNITNLDTPSSSIAINQIMTKNQQTFNGTIKGQNFTNIGYHTILISCSDGVNFADGNIRRYVSASGFTGTLGFYIILIGITSLILITGFYLRDPAIVVLGSFGLYFVGLYILFYGIVDIKDTVYTWGIGLILLGFATYLSTKASYDIIDN